MRKIVFITGGQRSGKSSFAQKRALSLSDKPVYLATAHIWDDDFKARVKRHREDRGNEWDNFEEEMNISRLNLTGRVVVIDCITLWLTNFFYHYQYDVQSTLDAAFKEWELFIEQDFTLFVVSNEIGMGVHAENESSRNFADLQGWMNQKIASDANEVYLMVSGLPLQIK
jgi:adenosylcobinamide kinase / adenosylcobinamide-phosphate guanylyltransferase